MAPSNNSVRNRVHLAKHPETSVETLVEIFNYKPKGKPVSVRIKEALAGNSLFPIELAKTFLAPAEPLKVKTALALKRPEPEIHQELFRSYPLTEIKEALAFNPFISGDLLKLLAEDEDVTYKTLQGVAMNRNTTERTCLFLLYCRQEQGIAGLVFANHLKHLELSVADLDALPVQTLQALALTDNTHVFSYLPYLVSHENLKVRKTAATNNRLTVELMHQLVDENSSEADEQVIVELAYNSAITKEVAEHLVLTGNEQVIERLRYLQRLYTEKTLEIMWDSFPSYMQEDIIHVSYFHPMREVVTDDLLFLSCYQNNEKLKREALKSLLKRGIDDPEEALVNWTKEVLGLLYPEEVANLDLPQSWLQPLAVSTFLDMKLEELAEARRELAHTR